MPDSASPVGELREATVPLGGTDLGSPINGDATNVLHEVVGDAPLVGLGETSHGSRAQFRLKHRLVRFLIRRTGVRAFALEEDANWVRRIDAYVVDDEGDIEDLLLEGHINWPWKTREMVELFDWMRSFNDGRDRADRVRVYGFDLSTYERIGEALYTHFEVAGADVPEVRDRVEALSGDQPRPAAEWLVDALPSLFEKRTDDHERRDAVLDNAFARLQTTLLAQRIDHDTDDTPTFPVREASMAENVSWIVDGAGADRAVIWAHNVHVGRQHIDSPDRDGRHATMGHRLAGRHGDDYVAIGTDLGGGTFLAINAETIEPATPSVPDPPAGSVSSAFSRIDTQTRFASTATLRANESLAAWLNAGPPRHRINGMIGGDFGIGGEPAEDGLGAVNYVRSDLSAFDGFAFVQTTEPNRLLAFQR